MRFNVVGAFVALLALASTSRAQIYTGGGSGLEPSGAESAASPVAVEPPQEVQPAPANNDIITQTVYGFLDFTTTIGNTVMVFSPQSAPPEGGEQAAAKPSPAIETKPAAEEPAKPDIKPSKTHKSVQETKKDTKVVVNSVIEQNAEESGKSTRIEVVTKSPSLSTLVEVRPKVDDVPGVKNNLAEPEYDFLSKQPAEVVDESYKVINLRPSAKSLGNKPRPSPRPNKENPTGLVTKLGGTIVKDGLTTVHETSVIGTYINGKYAQVLQSSSRVLNPPNPNNLDGPNKIRPSSSQRILKTIGPHQKIKHQQQQQQPNLESTIPLNDEPNPTEQPAGGRPGGRLRHSNNPVRSKFRNNNKIATGDESELNNDTPLRKNRPVGSRPGYKNRQSQGAGAATTSTESPNGTRRRSGFRPSNGNSNTSPKQYKSSKNSESSAPSIASNPAIKSKLPRTQGRWSYKTTPKPRIVIRKQAGDDEPQAKSAAAGPAFNPEASSNGGPQVAGISVSEDGGQAQPAIQRKEGGEYDGELDGSESEDAAIINVSVQQNEAAGPPAQSSEKILPVETINVEISTPADFNDVYFEIATIKSPYAFQVGTTRNTRYVTVTSTLKKSFATAEPSPLAPTEPLTENILAPNTGAAYESSLPLDSSIATLPAITLEPSMATPPLEILTETFSTTQTLLKTHLLPVVAANGNTTTRLTLVQTYNIARVVTATKTLPPSELYQFVPSKTLNEFNSKLDEAGSELHLELDFGDDERADDDDIPKRILAPSSDLDSDLDIFGKSSLVSPTSKLRSEHSSALAKQQPQPEPPMSPEQAQQLALLKLLGQNAPQVITTSKPIITLETVYDSHVIPLINNGHTVFSTISRAIATVPRTSYEYGTSTITPLLPPQVPQVPLFPPVQPQVTVTSLPFVQQTVATVSESKVLKLTFGAKTAYTTLYSTRLVPTETTTYVTSTIALQPNVPAYPGYFPPAVGYPGYPFVG